ncbi:MAG: 1,4-dihydroxy-2-naphthoate octaprenyltransferase [Dehalococcoidia bacterium]|nr:1,4-dihydroxy-2-naphthoate octaprenyltransferase [Dehalococcoidia bacterium]
MAKRTVTSTVHCDLEGKITYLSDGAQEIFQYTNEELLGKERVSVFSPGLVVLGHVPRWLKQSVTEGHFETDTVFVRKDGSQFAAHIRLTPIIKDGVQTGYIGLTTPLPDKSVEETMPSISMVTKILSWLYITRSPFLSATIVPVLLGTALASWLVEGDTKIGMFLLTLLGVSFAHLGVNTANDYFDWKSGADQANVDYVIPFSGGSRMIQLGVISPQGMLRTSLVLFGAAAIIGAYLATTLEIWSGVGILALAGFAIGFLYTAPPIRLAARGIGEIGIMVAFGPLIVAGAALIQIGSIEPKALLAGIPTGLLTAAIVWVNEFPDIKGDAASDKRTLVVRLGLKCSSWAYLVLALLTYASLIVLVLTETLPTQALAGLITVPFALYVTRQIFINYESRAIKDAMAGTIFLHFLTGILMVVGIWLAV